MRDTLRNRLFLRITLAAFFGGSVLLLNPGLGMLWQGVALIALGLVSAFVWHRGIGTRRSGARREPAGPTFSPEDPEVAALPVTTTTRLRDVVGRSRERQKRAGA